jgi:predicted TIM-barrel fold metal-dependent hydrolase
MDTHGIDVSIVSLANPWLDFLEPDEAVKAAHDLNLDIQNYCETYTPSNDSSFDAQTSNRLFAFGSLPLVPGIETEKVLDAIKQVGELSYLRGVVMGTKGIGKGLDDPDMEPIYEALASAGLVVFVVSFSLPSRSITNLREIELNVLFEYLAPSLRYRERFRPIG